MRYLHEASGKKLWMRLTWLVKVWSNTKLRPYWWYPKCDTLLVDAYSCCLSAAKTTAWGSFLPIKSKSQKWEEVVCYFLALALEGHECVNLQNMMVKSWHVSFKQILAEIFFLAALNGTIHWKLSFDCFTTLYKNVCHGIFFSHDKFELFSSRYSLLISV